MTGSNITHKYGCLGAASVWGAASFDTQDRIWKFAVSQHADCTASGGQNRVHCPGYGRVVISGEKQWQESNSGLKYRMTLNFEREKSVRGNDFAAQE